MPVRTQRPLHAARRSAGLMICYLHVQQPIHLDPAIYECVTPGTEFLRPYASEVLVAKGDASLPGRASHAVSLLMDSPCVYFARLVDLILENAPIFDTRAIESDMPDVVRNSTRRPGYCLG
jgi:LysR family transcriptional regulator, hypochlorite-specific transcription factor HypT